MLSNDSQKITIRKSVRKDIAEKIPEYLNLAVLWMQEKYPYVNFKNLDYIFSSSFSRSRYFRNETRSEKYIKPVATISTRAMLMLYNKKSLKIKNRKIYVGHDVQIVCALIHELTHHVQYEKRYRVGNELDTTANELQYLKDFYPEYYSEITEI